MVELKNDEKNGVLPTINALKWFIKKQITNVERAAWVISVQFQHIHLLSFRDATQ